MAIATAYWAADLDAMVDDLPATFLFGALSFSCSVTDLSVEQTLLLTGNNAINAIRAIFNVDNVPTASTALNINGRVQIQRPGETAARNYAVVTIEKSPDNVSYTAVLKHDSRA